MSALPAPDRSYALPVEASPDGRHLAVVTQDLTEAPLWIHDIARGTLDKLTPEGEAVFSRWSPDGQRIAFFWLSGGRRQLAWQRVDGTTPPEVLGQDAGYPSSWSPDGRQLALLKGADIWVATVEGSKASFQQITRTPEEEGWPEFSPDGRWLVYGSNVSGRFEVYMQPWPGPGPREQVSLTGGSSPAWNPNWRELIFLLRARDQSGKHRMMVADVRTRPTLTVGTPRPLFDFLQGELLFSCVPARCYSMAPDGQRFFVTRRQPTVPSSPVTHIQLVQNWTEELKARVPSGLAR